MQGIIVDIARVLEQVEKEEKIIIPSNQDADYTCEDILFYVEPILEGLKVTYTVEFSNNNQEAILKTYS